VENKSNTPGFWKITLLFVGFSLVLKLSSWNFPHNLGDEPIFWGLSENLIQKGEYNLSGKPILQKLPLSAYDRKLFHHPPLYPTLLMPFVLWGSTQTAMLLSWGAHGLTLVAIALILRSMLAAGPEGFDSLSPCFWIPMLGAAVDPFLMFMSTKLWIDGILTALVTLSMSFFILAGRARKPALLLASGGVVLGVAALTKLVAVVLMPVAAAVIWFEVRGNLKTFLRSALIAFVPVVVLVSPWVAIFYRQYGELTPSWFHVRGSEFMQMPFAVAWIERPVTYYLAKTGMVQPLFVLGLVFCLNRTALANLTYRIGLIWCVGFLAAITFLSTDFGFQMRYIGPMVPAFYLMLSGLLQCAHRRRGELALAGMFCIAYAACSGALYLFNPDYHEVYSFLEWGRFVSFEP
jgi:4-amino-4-deoxy-L-arabinose transferase-like glycosyltransferase